MACNMWADNTDYFYSSLHSSFLMQYKCFGSTSSFQAEGVSSTLTCCTRVFRIMEAKWVSGILIHPLIMLCSSSGWGCLPFKERTPVRFWYRVHLELSSSGRKAAPQADNWSSILHSSTNPWVWCNGCIPPCQGEGWGSWPPLTAHAGVAQRLEQEAYIFKAVVSTTTSSTTHAPIVEWLAHVSDKDRNPVRFWIGALWYSFLLYRQFVLPCTLQ